MIKKSNLAPLRLMAFAQVMKNVQSFLNKEHDLQNKGLVEVKKEFDTAFSALEKSLHQAKINEQTQNILDLDKQRDIALSSFITHCKLFRNHPENHIAEAAKRASIHIKSYGKDMQRRAYRDETAIIRSLVAAFEEPQHNADIQLIGAKQWLTHLKPLNEKFDELHSNRTMEDAEKDAGKSRDARREMQAKFDRLCKAIEAMAFMRGEDEFRSLANAINEEVKNALATAK